MKAVDIVDKGEGPAIVLVPGMQGRWEYLAATVDALAKRHRVITFSLCDEHDPIDTSRGIDQFVAQIDDALDSRGLSKAVICGVSLGGLIALRFAARRPERTAALVVVSAPGPGWHLRRTHQLYARFPWLLGPLFFVGVPARLRSEILAAIPDRHERWTFLRRLLRTLVQAPVSPSKMAARARLIDGVDNASDCTCVEVPTLLMTGEHALDHVVPANGSNRYAELIRGAQSIVLERTGHLGCVTRPDAFADIVSSFLDSAGIDSGSRGHAA